MFELNKANWYTVELCQENDFLNSMLETKDYGIWYSVKFEGDANSFLWQTKTEPQEDKKYWGWLEKTKSGKSIKFHWDKQNEPSSETSTSPSRSNAYLKDISDLPDRWLARLLPFYDAQSLVKDGKPSEQFRNLVETAQVFTDESLAMIERIRND